MKVKNDHGAPESFVRFCEADEYSKGGADYSVTELIEEPRIVQLKRRYPELDIRDPYEDPWLFIGQMFHKLMEMNSPEDEISERRFFNRCTPESESEHKIISGAIDVIKIRKTEDAAFVTLGDYKVTSAFSLKDIEKPPVKWEQQLNLYAYLFEEYASSSGVSMYPNLVIDLEIYAFLRDWRITVSEKVDSYPRRPGVTVPIPLWPYDERKAYMDERLTLQVESEKLEDDDLPECSDEAVWPSGTRYRISSLRNGVMKYYKAKRDADKYYNSLDFVEQLDISVDKVCETHRRCKSYCDFSRTCNQWKKWREENNHE